MSNEGFYLNSGKDLFVEALNGQIYMDKTAMVAEINALVNSLEKILCVSWARRFGKSMAMAMLAAYYGADEDYRALFEPLLLSKCPNWDCYLGKFDVLRLVMTDLLLAFSFVKRAAISSL
ncbi:MAG: AAA family ATPase [Victivallales bacterium]|nr:AAA family ATPase [Victivallales bacterium]